MKLYAFCVWSSHVNLISAFGTKYMLSLNQSRWTACLPKSVPNVSSCNNFICWLTHPNLLESLPQCEIVLPIPNKNMIEYNNSTLRPALIRTPAICASTPPFKSLRLPARSKVGSTPPTFSSCLPQDFFLQALLLHTGSVLLTKAWLLEIPWRSDPIKRNHIYFMQRSTRSNEQTHEENEPSSVQLNRTCLSSNDIRYNNY